MREDSWEICLEGESAVLEWRNNQIYAQGYDLESEKTALLLTNYTRRGIGALLLAINDLNIRNRSLRSDLKQLTSDLATIEAAYEHDGTLDLFVMNPTSILTPSYLSYDPNPSFRVWAVQRLEITKKNMQRLCTDKAFMVTWHLAQYPHLNEEAQVLLARHPKREVREELIHNNTIGAQAMLILLKNTPQYAHRILGEASNLPLEIQAYFLDEKILEQDNILNSLKAEKDMINKKIKALGKELEL